MIKIYLKNDNTICYDGETKKSVTISVETFNKITNCEFGHAWHYNEETKDFEYIELIDEESLRDRRQVECFNILDSRSKFWWDNLTEEQNIELKQWYQDWLKVTETKVIPIKPEWLH